MKAEQFDNHPPMISAKDLSYTLENCIKAKDQLIKDGMKESDFYLHDSAYSDHYLHNEPMVKCKDDECISALELYKQKYLSEEDDKNMADFYIENNLI